MSYSGSLAQPDSGSLAQPDLNPVEQYVGFRSHNTNYPSGEPTQGHGGSDLTRHHGNHIVDVFRNWTSEVWLNSPIFPLGPPTLPPDTEGEITEFARGIDGERPEEEVVRIATEVARVAADRTEDPEITVDVDGALSFDLRLRDGQLVLAEIDMFGRIDVSVYNAANELEQHHPNATCDDLIAVIGR